MNKNDLAVSRSPHLVHDQGSTMKIVIFGKEMTESVQEGMTSYNVAVETAVVCVFGAGGEWGATWASGSVRVEAEKKYTPQAAARSLENIIQGTVPSMVRMVHKIRSFPHVGDHSLLSILTHMDACPEAVLFVEHTRFNTFEEIYGACTLPCWFGWLCWKLETTRPLIDQANALKKKAALGASDPESLGIGDSTLLAFYQRPDVRSMVYEALVLYAYKHWKELT